MFTVLVNFFILKLGEDEMLKSKRAAEDSFPAVLPSNKLVSKRGVSAALLSAALCSSVSVGSTSSTVSAFNPLSAIGTGLSAIGSFLGKTAQTIGPLAMGLTPLMQGYFMYKMYAEPKIQQLKPKINPLRGITLLKMRKLVELCLQSVVGQDKAKVQLKNAFMNIAYDPDRGPHVFYLVGPSGCGKNVITENVIKPIMCGSEIKPYIMEASYVNVDKNCSTSVPDQIFGFKVLGNSMSGQVMPSPLVSYIRSNPYGLVVFNEFDKRKNDKGETVAELIEENMRTILDQGGLILPDGSWLDCSHITFCFTSNELDECVTNINNFESLNIDEIRAKPENASRTVVKHDRSVFNRNNMHVVTLGALKNEDYFEMAKREYLGLITKFTMDYGVHLFYQGNFEQVSAGIAAEAIKLGNGGRGVRTIVESLQSQILSKILMPNLEFDLSEGLRKHNEKIHKNFIVVYDPNSGNFVCGKFDVKTGTVSDPNPERVNATKALAQPTAVPKPKLSQDDTNIQPQNRPRLEDVDAAPRHQQEQKQKNEILPKVEQQAVNKVQVNPQQASQTKQQSAEKKVQEKHQNALGVEVKQQAPLAEKR